MRKQLKIISICMICILSAAVFCACNKKRYTTFVYDDYFVCYTYSSEIYGNNIAILELTELGKEQEVLIIPETINGVSVKWLGGSVPEYYMISAKKLFKSERLKKLYIPFAMKFQSSGDLVYVQNATVISFVDKETYGTNDDYITGHCKKQAFLFKYERKVNHIVCSNCFFYKNDTLVWADYIDDDEVYALPVELQIDWYYEPECINLWNGEYVIPDGEEQLNLYSK